MLDRTLVGGPRAARWLAVQPWEDYAVLYDKNKFRILINRDIFEVVKEYERWYKCTVEEVRSFRRLMS